MKLIIALCLLLQAVYCNSQSISALDSLLLNTENSHKHVKSIEVEVMKTKKKSVLVRYNPIVLMLKGSMYLYQKVLSPQLATNCPFEYSCSNFSKACIKEYGFIKGVALTTDRLTRCTPFSGLDFNPIFVNKDNRIIDNPWSYRINTK